MRLVYKFLILNYENNDVKMPVNKNVETDLQNFKPQIKKSSQPR